MDRLEETVARVENRAGLDREPTPAPPAGQAFAPKLLHDPGTCGLCDHLRAGGG